MEKHELYMRIVVWVCILGMTAIAAKCQVEITRASSENCAESTNP